MSLYELKKRILQISYEKKLSHIGSCLTSVSTIDKIYKDKRPEDVFVLSNGHAGLALYVVLEKYFGEDAEKLFDKHGVHPNTDDYAGIVCSTGSLGMGLPISVGLALGNRHRQVHCLISDGECAEGSIWESLQFIESKGIDNLHVYVIINGYSAYDPVNVPYLEKRLKVFLPRINLMKVDSQISEHISGLDSHYGVLDDQGYLDAKNFLKRSL